MKILTQKKGTNNCGAIAIINFLNLIKVPHKLTQNKLSKKIAINSQGFTDVFEITKELDQLLPSPIERIARPNKKDLINKYKKSSIILFDEYTKDAHFCAVVKVTKKYIYLLNDFCHKEDKYLEFKKHNIDEFFKNNRIYWIMTY